VQLALRPVPLGRAEHKPFSCAVLRSLSPRPFSLSLRLVLFESRPYFRLDAVDRQLLFFARSFSPFISEVSFREITRNNKSTKTKTI